MSIAGTAVTTIIPDEIAATEAWAGRIGVAWQKSVEAIFETGRLLLEAKAALPHGAFGKMIESQLPFKRRAASVLMKIARDQRLNNPETMKILPPSWGTLIEVARLSDAALDQAIRAGVIRPDTERKEVLAMRRGLRRTKASTVRLSCGDSVASMAFGSLRERAIALLIDAETLLTIHGAGTPSSTVQRVGEFYSESALAEVIENARTAVRERLQ